jgi:hypothetical protein
MSPIEGSGRVAISFLPRLDPGRLAASNAIDFRTEIVAYDTTKQEKADLPPKWQLIYLK